MKKFILGVLIGIIIALSAFIALKQDGQNISSSGNNSSSALNKIRLQKNYQNDTEEKLQEAVLNLSKANKPEDILKSLDEILKYRPQDANVYALKAQVLQKQGNLPAALEAINRAISIDPKNPNYYQMRAEIEFNAGNFSKAERDFTTAAQLSGKADNYYNRAIANLNLGNYAAANNDFKKASDLYRKEGNLGASNQAQNISQMLTKNMPKQATKIKANSAATNKPKRKAPDNAVVNQKVMNQISKSLKHFSESETLKEFKDYFPESGDAISSLSNLPIEMPKTETPTPQKEEAIPTLEETIKQQNIKAPKINKKDLLKGSALESLTKAKKMLANKDFEGAKSVLDSAINNYPDNDSLYYQRAQANYQNGDYKAALADLNKALELNPNNYQAALSKGDLFNSLGQSKQAKKAYLEAADLAAQAGNARAAEDAQTRYQLLEGKEISARNNQRFAEASNAYKNGDYSTAINLFNQIYQENPDGANAFNLGLAYMGQGNMQEANKMFVRAAEDKPKDLNVQLAAAHSSVGIEDFDSAKEYLDKAKEINDNSPDVWALSAQVNVHDGNYAEAKNDLKKALVGFEQKLGEVTNENERQQIEKQISEINAYLEQMAQAGI